MDASDNGQVDEPVDQPLGGPVDELLDGLLDEPLDGAEEPEEPWPRCKRGPKPRPGG